MEPTGTSLSGLGLFAPGGLQCPEGGTHHVLQAELAIAQQDGGGAPRCQRCGQTVPVVSVRELDD